MEATEATYTDYTPQFKDSVVSEYIKGEKGRGCKALAERFKIRGGHNVVKYWAKQYTGDRSSLEKKHGGA
jgi:transposase-like protein